MNISSNFAVLLTLNDTRRNNQNIDKIGRIVSSGQKINSAKDDASSYAISENMKTQIRALNQDIVNSRTGRNLISVAEGGIQEIVNNLRFLKEKAINAANDTNTDADRKIIQKEVNQRLDVIDDIAATTNYNGRLLLDGTWGERGPHLLGTTTSDDSTEPVGEGTIIPKGDYTINADGVYIMSKGYEGHITINAQNVKIMQEDPDELIRKTSLECTNSESNLWLENVSIVNTSYIAPSNPYAVDRNLLKFNGEGNTLNIKGKVTLENGGTSTSENFAVINVGEGLSIYGHGEKSDLRVIQFDYGPGQNSTAAAIGTDSGRNYPKNKPDIYIANLSKLQTFSEDGPSIGAGAKTTIGDITIVNIGILDVNTSYGAGIGAIKSNRMGNSSFKSNCGNITIQADKFYGTGMSGSSAVLRTFTGNIDINSDYIFLAVRPSESSDGYRKLSSSGGSTIDPPLGATVNGSPFKPNGKTYTPNPSYSNSQVYVYPDYSKKDEDEPSVEGKRRLIIHTGTNSSENMNVIINSMDTWTLGLKDMKLTTRKLASLAISQVDKAIEYSLKENTRLGAYYIRLGYTIDNLTTAHENTTAADSVIRDADMAKSMTDYAKANVLAQASQSMLAQANQNSSQALSLLQNG